MTNENAPRAFIAFRSISTARYILRGPETYVALSRFLLLTPLVSVGGLEVDLWSSLYWFSPLPERRVLTGPLPVELFLIRTTRTVLYDGVTRPENDFYWAQCFTRLVADRAKGRLDRHTQEIARHPLRSRR